MQRALLAPLVSALGAFSRVLFVVPSFAWKHLRGNLSFLVRSDC